MHKQTKNLKKNLTTVLVSLGGMLFFSVVIYALGTLDGVNSSNTPSNGGLTVQGVPNRVEKLKSLTITGGTAQSSSTKLEYTGGYLEIEGNVNMDSLVVGNNNSAGEGSAVFGGQSNKALAPNSAIAGGNENRIPDGSNGSNSVISASSTGNVSASQQVLLGATTASSVNASTNSALMAGEGSRVTHAQQTFVAGDGHSVSNTNSAVILGSGVNVNGNRKNQIFVYSNSGTFSPANGNAFYINAQSGVAVNKTAANVPLDIDGELALKAENKLPDSDSSWEGTIALVSKPLEGTTEQKSGLCGHNGVNWDPLTESAFNHKLCVAGLVNACPDVPAHAHRDDLNSPNCNWSCDMGYAKVGGQCEKVVWKEATQNQCKAGGLLNEGETIYRPECKSSDGKIQPDSICDHWIDKGNPKPNVRSEFRYDPQCNKDRWDCSQVDCNVRGKCGNYKETITCSAQAKNQQGQTFHDIKEEDFKCNRPCENGACGRPNGEIIDDIYNTIWTQKCAPESGVRNLHRDEANYKWTWECKALDSDASCQAQKTKPEAGKCLTDANGEAIPTYTCARGEVIDKDDTGEKAITWKCSTKGGDSGLCVKCKSGFTWNSDSKSCELKATKCNKCRRQGFPYCFNVDMSPNCDGGKAPKNGECGAANDKHYSDKPTTNLCDVGTASIVSDLKDGAWEWTCSGEHNGTTASCKAYQTPQCYTSIARRSASRNHSHTFYFSSMDTHQVSTSGWEDTVYSVYYYKGENENHEYRIDSDLCEKGVVNVEQLSGIYNALGDGKSSISYTCSSTHPSSAQSVTCQMTAKPNLVIRQQSTETDIGFKVEECPEGYLLNGGICSRCPVGMYWDGKKCQTPCKEGYRRNTKGVCVKPEYSRGRCEGGRYDVEQWYQCVNSVSRENATLKFNYSRIPDYQCEYKGYQTSQDNCRNLVIGTFVQGVDFDTYSRGAFKKGDQVIMSRCIGGSGLGCSKQETQDSRWRTLDLYNPQVEMAGKYTFFARDNSPFSYATHQNGTEVMSVQEACSWVLGTVGKDCESIRSEPDCWGAKKGLGSNQGACHRNNEEFISKCKDENDVALDLDQCTFS